MIPHNPGDFVGELFKLENSRGDVLEFNQDIYMPVYQGFGTPRIDYVTRKGYQQDGATLIDSSLGERIINIEIFQQSTGSGDVARQLWWDLRKQLVAFFRAEVGSPIALTILQPDGTQYSIDVYGDPGPEFGTPQEGNENNIQQSISLKAFNPVWYKTNLVSLDLVSSEDSQLVFPITFPILFGAGGTFFSTGALNYGGSWKSFPIITIHGPYTSVAARLINKDIQFQLVRQIVQGQGRIINTDPANLSIVDLNGVSRFDELSLPSNLVDFFIPPAPEGLTEELRITLLGGDIDISTVTVSYRENYLGI